MSGLRTITQPVFTHLNHWALESKQFKAFILLQLFAFWPSWQWYVLRMRDGSDEPWGVVALVCALLFALRGGRRQEKIKRPKTSKCSSSRYALIVSALLTIVYCMLYGSVSSLPLALVAVTALSFSISSIIFGTFLHFGLFGLMVLSLPIIASLQFYAGFPIRALTAQCSALIISLLGYPVTSSGTVLQYFGEVIAVDAPCAGIKILWSSLLLHFVLSAFGQRSFKSTWFGYAITNLIVFLTNVLRTSILFFTESGVVRAPDWAHQGVGLLVFVVAVVSILQLHRVLAVWDKCYMLEGAAEYINDKQSDDAVFSPPVLGSSMKTSEHILRLAFLMLCLTVAVYPAFGAGKVQAQAHQEEQVNWPQEFRGQPLHRLPLSEKETKFTRNFPGAIARFTDGQNEVLIRWVTKASRQLHPASDCLKGAGFTVSPLPVMADSRTGYWNCVLATKGSSKYRVCEQIRATNARVYSDVSTWYWSALLDAEEGPWFAYTLAEELSS